MNSEDVLKQLEKRRAGRPIADLATDIGVSSTYLYDIVKKRRKIGPRILDYLGIERTFGPKKKA